MQDTANGTHTCKKGMQEQFDHTVMFNKHIDTIIKHYVSTVNQRSVM